MHAAPVVLAGPAGRCRLLALPHPQSGIPAYFGVHEVGKLYEVLIVRDGQRSWLVGESPQVVADGALRLLSPVDPAFVLLGALGTDNTSYLTADDLFEAAAERCAHARTGTWPDIAELARYSSHLDRICDTQHVDGHESYRVSRDKVRALIDAKIMAVEAAADGAPETLGAQVRRLEDAGEPPGDARHKVARDLVLSYVSPTVVKWLG